MHNIALLDPELQELDGLPKAIQSKFSLSFPALEIRGRSFSDLIKFMEFRDGAVFYHIPTRVTSKSRIVISYRVTNLSMFRLQTKGIFYEI
jgi:hypothetical protein